MPLLSGDKIESYELVRKCGRGAFGEVWIAKDPLQRMVALKLIDKFSRAKDELKGLMTYFEMPPNPHLITIYHIGETEDFFYYTMELADNASNTPEKYVPKSLESVLSERGAFSVSETLALGNKLLVGLVALHKAGMVHRDMKPSNIIFVNGEPKISDVGLLFKANIPATLIGSIGFITPERLSSPAKCAYTASDDLYALGKILYCMWTGNPPEEYPSLPAKCFASTQDATLNNIIKNACSHDPVKRFQRDESFMEILDKALNSGAESAGKVSSGADAALAESPKGEPAKRKKSPWLIVGLVLLGGILGLSVFMGRRRGSVPEATTVVGAPHDYLVIDLSSGPTSEHYPVRWSAIPPDLTSMVCRTDELWLKRIPAGSFLMGSPLDEKYRQSNEVLHKVDIHREFYMGIFEVTQMQYTHVTGKNSSRAQGDARPMDSVSYSMIRYSPEGWPLDGHRVRLDTFVGLLQKKTGLLFDLPMEAEWEYACRAGTNGPLYLEGIDYTNDTVYAQNLAKIARFDGNRREIKEGAFREHTMVGSYLPNAWGLYDMQGNVWELCLDWYEDEPAATPGLTPKGPEFSQLYERVMRGGDWLSHIDDCRAARRRSTKPGVTHATGGFRIAYSSDLPPISLR